MSDIWIKTTNTGTTRWRKALSIKMKRFSSTWVAAKVIWIKNASSGWLRVWPTSGVFAETDPYITTTASGSTPFYGNLTVGTNDVMRIGTAYYGRNGTWNPNGFTISSYSYSWSYYSDAVNQPGDYDLLGNLGTGTYASPSQALTISFPADATAVDGKYISFKITANASNALYSNTADSKDSYGKIRVIRRTPINISFTINGSTTVGSVLSVGSSWNITEARKPDAFRNTIKWYRSDSATDIYAGGSRTEITSASGSYQYTLAAPADTNKYIIAEETTFNTGSDYDIGVDQFINGQNQVTAVTAKVTSAYSFAFGNTLYVGSNGYIGLDNGGSVAGTAGNGRTLNIWNEDLVQYRLQEYSDSSNYYLYFRSYRYQSPLVQSAINALDYQIKFYTGQPYCDVYLVRKGSSVPTYIDNPGYYSNGLFNTSGFSGTFTAGSVLRIYFNGTTPANTSAASWTSISDSVWKDITTAQIDDSFTTVVTSANQQAPILNAPTITSVTPGPAGGPVSVAFTGGSGPFYQAYWGGATAPTTAVTPDASGSSSPLTDNTGPVSTTTVYMYVRSVLTQAETSVGPSSLASAWSAGVPFNMTSTAVSQSTAPTARATSTNSTSIVKYLDSITWSTGTYTNQASKTSVLLYSTNTSNLVSPGGDTNTSTRTSSPYAIQTSDPAGTPYVFAVRDTVVGINGTTYYFYSNQITSANADAVAFSYGTATSAAGGWTASVNSGAQTGATYSITSGTGSINASTGQVTVTGLGSNTTTSVTVTKSVSGYNSTTAPASGTSATVVTYSLNYSANGGSSTPLPQTGASGSTITLASSAGTRSGFTFGGWNISGTTYSAGGAYTFGSADATATAIWNAVFVVPTSPAPSWTSGGNFQRITGSSILRWYTDYPSISGSGSITGMDFEIRTTAGGGTLLASGTRSYPGAGSYPYSGGGTIWAFRCGTSDGDISYSSSARFARARVRMLGTNGTTYFGTWTGWI
jgi:hypothetical protein